MERNSVSNESGAFALDLLGSRDIMNARLFKPQQYASQSQPIPRIWVASTTLSADCYVFQQKPPIALRTCQQFTMAPIFGCEGSTFNSLKPHYLRMQQLLGLLDSIVLNSFHEQLH